MHPIYVSVYQQHMLVFVDADQRDATRRYGCSMRGRPIKSHKLMLKGEHTSVLMA